MSNFLRSMGAFGCFCILPLFSVGQALNTLTSSQSAKPATILTQRLPLAFEENVGQSVAGIDYLVRSGIMLGEIRATEMRLSLPPVNGQQEQVSIQLDGARKDARPTAGEKLEGESNYLLGIDASAWKTHVARYGRVTYSEVYDGIDLVYYGTGSQVEHDFVVHPGATPSSIRLKFDGVRKLEVTKSGDLQVSFDQSQMTLRQPRAYQISDGVRHEVAAKFIVANGGVRFHLGTYDRTKLLVIDPVLDYSTFLGDASVYVKGVAVDAAGNTYISGVASVGFAANGGTNACSSCVSGTNKGAVYVIKLNATGTAVIYSTFIGGSVNPYGSVSNDQPNALTVDLNNNAIVTGHTSSTDFPLKNPISSGVPSFNDGFLTSLTPDGSALNFSSRLGGDSSASGTSSLNPLSLTTDGSGNVYVAGDSESPYLPTTAGALHSFSPSFGHTGAFLLKLSSSGSLGYGAIVGELGSASGGVGPTGLAVDESGVVYMAGTAGSTGGSASMTTPWPTTSGAYQTALVSPSENAPFVTRISADGSSILSSTLAGTGRVLSMALTPQHDVLISGVAGKNFPVTSDAYNSDVTISTFPSSPSFFAKVSGDGTQLLYASMFGPSGSTIYINGIGQDPSGNVWLAGTTSSLLPSLVHPLQSTYSSQFSGDGFIAKFDPMMHNLLFSSYVNSTTGFSQINGLAVDSNGLAHVVGIASQDFPTTPNASLRAVTPPPPNYSYNYGFAALIDGTNPGPSVCFTGPSSAGALVVGTTGQRSFNINNCGDGPLTISSLQLTSDVFALTSADACTGNLDAGKACTVPYSFTPKVTGAVTANVLINSNAPMAANMQILRGTGIDGPAVSLSTKTLTFSTQAVGSTSAAQVVTVTNLGTKALTGLSIVATGMDASSFIMNSTCSGQLAAGSSCSVNILFNPVTSGVKQAALQIADNALDSPQQVMLNGTAAVPTFNISSSSLNFGKVAAGGSVQQTLTLQNTGDISLSNIALAISGPNAANFVMTTTCGANLAVSTTCNITVTFNPTGAADETAIVTIGATGATSQTVTVTGISAAPDFLFPAPAGSSTATISAGQPANFNLSITPYGAFTGTITMSCTNLPVNAACAFTPASFALGATSTPVSLTITTQQTVRAALRPQHESSSRSSSRGALAILLLLPAASRARRRFGNAQLVLWLIVLFTGSLVFIGCSGVSSGSSAPIETIQKTPAGTYSVPVVASSGAVSHSTNVTLVVQ